MLTTLRKLRRSNEKASQIPLGYLREPSGPDLGWALTMIESEREKSASRKKLELVDISIARDCRQLLGPRTLDPGAPERPDVLRMKAESGCLEPGLPPEACLFIVLRSAIQTSALV